MGWMAGQNGVRGFNNGQLGNAMDVILAYGPPMFVMFLIQSFFGRWIYVSWCAVAYS